MWGSRREDDERIVKGVMRPVGWRLVEETLGGAVPLTRGRRPKRLAKSPGVGVGGRPVGRRGDVAV